MDHPDLGDFQDDPAVLQILEGFWSSVFPSDLDALDAALGRGDLAEVGRIAHRLKGSVGGYLSAEFPASAERLEKEAKGDARPEVMLGCVAELRRLGLVLATRPRAL